MKFRILIVIGLAVTIAAQTAEAKRKKRGRRPQSQASGCGPGKLSSTIYNLPHQDKKETWRGYNDFRCAVEMQGSGIWTRKLEGSVDCSKNYKTGRKPKRTAVSQLKDKSPSAKGGHSILDYQGKETRVRPTCKTTTTSSSGNCLLSMFSVAADPGSGWDPGDIIYIRELADKEMTLPSGKKIRHPGYFIVHDRGGWIKGGNRFDFFVGASDASNNSLSKLGLGNKNACNLSYKKVTGNQYRDALAAIHFWQDDDTSLPRGYDPDFEPPQRSLASERTGTRK